MREREEKERQRRRKRERGEELERGARERDLRE